MTDVACFCGCLYSFDGGAGACPKCGEVASVTGPPVLDSPGCNRPEAHDAEIRQLSEIPVPAGGRYRLDQQGRPEADPCLSRLLSLSTGQGRLP